MPPPAVRCDRCTAQLTPRQELECLCVCLGAALCVPCGHTVDEGCESENPIVGCCQVLLQFCGGLIFVAAILPLAILRALELLFCECAFLPDEYHDRRPVDMCSLGVLTGSRSCNNCYDVLFTLTFGILCCPCLAAELVKEAIFDDDPLATAETGLECDQASESTDKEPSPSTIATTGEAKGEPNFVGGVVEVPSAPPLSPSSGKRKDSNSDGWAKGKDEHEVTLTDIGLGIAAVGVSMFFTQTEQRHEYERIGQERKNRSVVDLEAHPQQQKIDTMEPKRRKE